MRKVKNCQRCWWDLVHSRQALEDWLAEMLGAEFYYHWRQRDALGSQGGCRVVHPAVYQRWLEQGPCADCPCRAHCDEICALRAAWWDAKIRPRH